MKFPLSMRIFVLTTALILAAVSVLSWQNGKLLRSLLTRNFQTFSMNAGERISSEMEKFILRTDQDLYRSIQSSVLSENDQSTMDAFFKGHDDAVAIAILRDMEGRLDLIRNVTTLKPAPDILTSFTWLSSKIKEYPEKFSHFSVLTSGDQKFVAIARRFKVQTTQATFWGIATVKTSMFDKLFGKRDVAEVGLADTSLNLLSGNFAEEKAWSEITDQKTFKQSVEYGIGSAFLGESRDSSGERWLGSFVRIPQYDLVIYIRQNASEVYNRINQLLYGTALWSALIFLIAIAASFLSANSITKKLRKVIEVTERIAQGDFERKIEVKSSDEVGLLVTSVNWMAEKIAQLLKVEKEKVRFEQEIGTAQMVQDTFFCDPDYKSNSLEISGYHNPSSECCGDWWSRVTLPNGAEQIYIGDATGHGAGAALVTAIAYTTIKNLYELHLAGKIPELTPKDVLSSLNTVMVDTLKGSMFMTFLIIEVSADRKTLTYANAGHCFPYLMPKNPEDDDRLDSASQLRGHRPIISPAKGRAVLGAARESQFSNETIELKPGDRIFMYTDGSFEFIMEQGKQYGVKNLQKTMMAYRNLPLADFRSKLSEVLEEERRRGIAEDDMTFVSVEVG